MPGSHVVSDMVSYIFSYIVFHVFFKILTTLGGSYNLNMCIIIFAEKQENTKNRILVSFNNNL